MVGVIMGSDSDWPIMRAAAEALDEFERGLRGGRGVGAPHPAAMLDYGATAADRACKVIIAGAGGAAHLPGMVASVTPLPVIGVPVPLKHLDGMDSLLSIVQMPAGIPVATVSIGGARNAGLLAVRILGAADPALRDADGRLPGLPQGSGGREGRGAARHAVTPGGGLPARWLRQRAPVMLQRSLARAPRSCSERRRRCSVPAPSATSIAATSASTAPSSAAVENTHSS